ncbi:hypothetical protein [Tenacibaculum xiamenense]|uniref:hypothetical protein n=1 Tax=Tenacibaculum xiamenense TaxID=1261553 RepID=UPI003894F69C
MTKENLLESKLKRLKISYSRENNKIVIGKAKMDYPVFFGLIVLPSVIGIALLVFLLSDSSISYRISNGKVIGALILLFGTAFFNISRMRAKSQSNQNLKILLNNSIQIKSSTTQVRLDSTNSKRFEPRIKEVQDDVLEGTLVLIDKSNNEHQILGFDSENEQYLEDDLKWFTNYFTEYLELNKNN